MFFSFCVFACKNTGVYEKVPSDDDKNTIGSHRNPKFITTSSGVTMSLLRATCSDESTRVNHVAWLLVCMSYLAHSYIFVHMIHLTSNTSIIHVVGTHLIWVGYG